MSILIKNATIINAKNTQKANILIKDNKITQISSAMSDADRVIDASGKLVMPGLKKYEYPVSWICMCISVTQAKSIKKILSQALTPPQQVA